jgi:hypothetical protein
MSFPGPPACSWALCPWKAFLLTCRLGLLSLAEIRIAEPCLNAPMQKLFKEHMRLKREIHWPLKLQMSFELRTMPVV